MSDAERIAAKTRTSPRQLKRVVLLALILGAAWVLGVYGPLTFARFAVLGEAVVEVESRAGAYRVDVCVGESFRYRWREEPFAVVLYSGKTNRRVTAWRKRGGRIRLSTWNAQTGVLETQQQFERGWKNPKARTWRADRAESVTPLDPTDCDAAAPWLKTGESPLAWYYRNGGK